MLTTLGDASLGLLEFALVAVAPFLLGVYYQKRKQTNTAP